MFSYAPTNSPTLEMQGLSPEEISKLKSDSFRHSISFHCGAENSKETAFSQSVKVSKSANDLGLESKLLQSVCVLPSEAGRYQVYKEPLSKRLSQSKMAQANPADQTGTPASKSDSGSFKFNISSPSMQTKLENLSKTQTAKEMKSIKSTRKSEKKSKSVPSSGRSTPLKSFVSPTSGRSTPTQSSKKGKNKGKEKLSDLECSCKMYHSHVFFDESINLDMVRQEELRIKTVNDSHQSSLYLAEGTDDPRHIFWTPALSFHPYKHGDPRVDFRSLWPSKNELREHLQNSGILSTVLRGAVLELGLQSIVCGPVRLLECIIQLCLIRADQQFENGSTMLHIACLSRNAESVQFLTQIGISPKTRDKHGYTADQVTFCPKIKKLLPPKYTQKDSSILGNRMLLRPSLQDKDIIFSLAKNPKNFDDIQKKLQTFDFNVNTECDGNGEFLLHVACKEGLGQLPLIMALVKIQMADVELCNGRGMTPLMLAAIAGNSVLCDVLMCLFGASPNKSNPNNGRFALHYAVEGNHRKTVECLIRRGADVNVEDHEGRRPDDVPACIGPDDCKEVINFNRLRRLESLSQGIKKGNLGFNELQYTDLFVVDDDGYTLIMMAAIYDQAQTMKKLLATNKTTINAQHAKTGMTALSIAAQMGNKNCVQLLLQNHANPSIGDMQNYLPIHHAVFHNHEEVVDALLEFFPVAFIGLNKAIRMSKKSSIHVKLQQAWDKRQDEIITQALLSCSFNGDADQLYVLLDEGDCINPNSGSGNWPMYLAVENGHLDVVILLHQKGGDIKKRHGTTGATVLHVAAKMGHYHIMEYLVKYCKSNIIDDHRYLANGLRRKLDINAVDAENKTSLQVAAEKGFSKIVQLLINHGSTTALLDNQGVLFTAWEYEGVRILIESQRDRHTKNIIKLISEKNKKALPLLQKIWLPRFDHNLRTKQGDTPLMIACQNNVLLVIKFLLQSAVYSITPDEDFSGDESDADSGVLDHTWAIRRKKKLFKMDEGEDISQISFNFNQSLEGNTGAGGLMTSGDFSQSVEVRNDGTLESTAADNKTLQVLLRDVDKPKGLQIFHDSTISHLCAVNLFNGNSPLHYAIKGDNLQIIRALLTADVSCLNIQNNEGLTALHVACKHNKRKAIELLLSYEGIDLNTRTLQGQLPEEMTSNKTIVKLIQKSRLDQTGVIRPPPSPDTPESFLLDNESPSTSKPPSVVASTISFDKVHTKYEALKKEVKTTEKS